MDIGEAIYYNEELKKRVEALGLEKKQKTKFLIEEKKNCVNVKRSVWNRKESVKRSVWNLNGSVKRSAWKRSVKEAFGS